MRAYLTVSVSVLGLHLVAALLFPPNKRLKLSAPRCGSNAVCAPTNSALISSIAAPPGAGAAA